jgi:hypothetical protein
MRADDDVIDAKLFPVRLEPVVAVSPSASNRGAFSCVNLLANNRDGPLIDRSSIPCLDGCEIGFARLVSRACAPAMGLKKICRRGQRIGRNIEISANAVFRMFLGRNCVWPTSPCIEQRVAAESVPPLHRMAPTRFKNFWRE